MYYIFVVNGRTDKALILPDLEKQISGIDGLKYEIYVTSGHGDGARMVRLYCEFNEKDEVCFVACGGSGTVNEVASGIIGHKNKRMAILAYGTTNDLTKYYPGRDFRSLKAIVESNECHKIDAIKCNDDYSVNVVNVGFTASVAFEADMNIKEGKTDGYRKALVSAITGHRFNDFKIVADGETINRGLTLLCDVGNAKYCGGKYLCCPRAVIDDGYMEVNVIRSIVLAVFLMILPKYTVGKHLEDEFCKKFIKYRRVRHLEISSKDLFYVSFDGEVIETTKAVFDVLDKAIQLVLPPLKEKMS